MPAPDLLDQLERARVLGFLGPGPVEAHIEHAQVFLTQLVSVRGQVVDLGSGGGVPGLVVAIERPDLQLTLVESMAKRAAFLREAVRTLSLTNVTVTEERAEVTGRGALRGQASAVTARSFGPPATTAECAAPLLRVGGLLVVSEPPESTGRWPAHGLTILGMAPIDAQMTSGPAVQVIQQVADCPDRFPRRVGVPAKRPLF
jgi:16S rRNA (guanine527-N7)-methyltransferase